VKKGRFIKKKGALVAIVGAVVIAGIGITFAVSQSRSVLNNDFELANYSTTATDTFTSPSNWQPCQTVPKTITVTNNSDKAVAVRIKLEEDWIASDGTTHLPLISAASGITMAQIEFTPNSGWTQDGAYYVYDTDLAANATTSSLITGVTLNCDANLDTSTNASATADGAYAGATYHLIATIQTIQADADDYWKTLESEIIGQTNNNPQIDFRKKAVVSNNLVTANGNGVNTYTEKGKTVYYYRGEIDNNNVVWADICWKIMRTTYSGGIKIVYNGKPSTVDGKKQCNDRYLDVVLSGRSYTTYDRTYTNEYNFPINYPLNSNQSSVTTLADLGYTYGDRRYYEGIPANDSRDYEYIFSKSFERNGNNYTLDTSSGRSVTISVISSSTQRDIILNGSYFYFCTNRQASCSSSEIAYMTGASSNGTVNYIVLGGYDNYADYLNASITGSNDSIIKGVIESWFEDEGLNNREGDLEDTIFCNDLSMTSSSVGILAGDDATSFSNIIYFGAYSRVGVDDGVNYYPSLDCPNRRDAYTKNDEENGNGLLNYKVGLLTADEMTMAGIHVSNSFPYGSSSYLGDVWYNWTMSPLSFSGASRTNYRGNYYVATSGNFFNRNIFNDKSGLRPVVSLKKGTSFSSGTGLKTDPYIVP